MKINLFLIAGLIAFGSVQAQSTSPFIINAAGGTGTVNSNSYDWSFGEMTMINTFSTANLIVTQGLLQPRYDSIAAGIENTSAALQNIKVFPNPAQDVVCFEADYKTAGRLNYDLTDMTGRTIISRKINLGAGNHKQTLPLSTLPAGVYILRITVCQEKETFIKNCKIQKIN